MEEELQPSFRLLCYAGIPAVCSRWLCTEHSSVNTLPASTLAFSIMRTLKVPWLSHRSLWPEAAAGWYRPWHCPSSSESKVRLLRGSVSHWPTVPGFDTIVSVPLTLSSHLWPVTPPLLPSLDEFPSLPFAGRCSLSFFERTHRAVFQP